MKKVIYLLVFIMILSVSVFAQEKKVKFKAYGNCEMCKNRIEKAARSVEGVTKAEWNQKTQLIQVTYNHKKVKALQIHKAIANAGHDTPKVRAKDDVYNKLPGCCKYKRRAHKEHEKKVEQKNKSKKEHKNKK